ERHGMTAAGEEILAPAAHQLRERCVHARRQLIDTLDQHRLFPQLEVALGEHQVLGDVSAHESMSAEFVVGCAAHHEILAVSDLRGCVPGTVDDLTPAEPGYQNSEDLHLKQTLPEGDHFLASQHGIEICVGSEHAVHGSYDQVGRGTRVRVHEHKYLARRRVGTGLAGPLLAEPVSRQ